MSYTLIAQSQVYSNITDTYQVQLFQDLLIANDPVNFRIIGDMKLRRGNSSPKNEMDYFAPTQIEFSILDENLWLTELMRGKPERDFQAVILKNGSTFFKGNLLNLYNKHIFTNEDGKVNLRIYDGVTRLKDFSDISALPDGITSIGNIVRNILNTLEFGLNIKIFMNMFPTPHTSGVAPAAAIGAKIIDFVNQDSNINYYTLLEKVLKQFCFTLFQEGGVWILRQDISLNSTGTTISNVNHSTGAITEASETALQSLTIDDLQYAPQAFFLDPVTKIILRVESKSPKTDTGDIGWKNEHFIEGSRGWTVEAGTNVQFNNESLRIFNSLTSGRVYQTTTYQFSPAEIAVIKFLCLSCRYMENIVDEGSFPFVSVRYINDDETEFWLNPDGSWTETINPIYFVAIQERNYIKKIATNEYINGYATVILEQEIEAPITLAMGFGYITVFLHGGGIPVYDHPYELTAQHNLCSVRLKSSDDDITQRPDSLDVTSSIADSKEFIITIPMHDEDPFITPSLYNLYDTTKTRYWSPDNTSLLEYLSAELLSYRTHNVEALDVKILPSVSFSYISLKKGNLTGSERSYVPVYEESNLIADNRRFVLVEATKKALTIKITKEYLVS